jgi:hypothetical protein
VNYFGYYFKMGIMFMTMGSSGLHVECSVRQDRARGINLHCPRNTVPAITFQPLLGKIVISQKTDSLTHQNLFDFHLVHL